MVIDVPRKIWRPKIKCRYKPPLYNKDVDEGIFLFESLGAAVFRPKPWEPGKRTDFILFNKNLHSKEFESVKVNRKGAGALLSTFQAIVRAYWDCFAPEGIRRVILGYEFAIDTGDATPVCCKKPHYGPNEAKVIGKHIRVLKGNDWIENCEGGWGSPIVLAPKPHQESADDIDDFVWRMCVSYRGLNMVTQPFEYPIGRCDAAIENLGDSAGMLWFICLDKAQGYHQIGVRKCDRQKLAFFGPEGLKWTFKVLPFGTTNAPPFYIAMIRQFQDEWTLIFAPCAINKR